MSKMKLIDEILKWSEGILEWQRDALRRLITSGKLDDKDINELTEICKGAYGLQEGVDSIPLSAEHIPQTSSVEKGIVLGSVTHVKGVNALAENQTLNFGPNITTVYGDNGAGKTGYIRILKTACLARGKEDILGNVTSGSAPVPYEVNVRYTKGTDEDAEWTGGSSSDLARVSVFDSQSASVYLTEKTDVAFRPYGLDLFDKLVQASKRIKAQLESEQSEFSTSRIQDLLTTIPEETLVGKMLAKITGLTNPDDVRSLATLSATEVSRTALVEKSISDLKSADPRKHAQQLELLKRRVLYVNEHIKNVTAVLSNENLQSISEARGDLQRSTRAIEELREATIQHGTLSGTGNNRWKALWDSAKVFSSRDAYPDRAFPHTTDHAKCVLCQQEFDGPSISRMSQFQTYVMSEAETTHREASQAFEEKKSQLVDITTAPRDVEEAIAAISIDNDAVAKMIRTTVAAHSDRKNSVVESLETGGDLPTDNYLDGINLTLMDRYVSDLDNRITTINTENPGNILVKFEDEQREFRARQALNRRLDDVLGEIERQKRLAAYQLAINDTRTNGITQKSTFITREVVTAQLQQTFKDELKSLNFTHIDVEIVEAGGSEGVLYHRLELSKAPGYKLPQVVSEGEQRCLSIAAFFAELSTAEDTSTIVFDDPMSSLDYAWRRGVAKRLVKEASRRQVIVFTHDIAFLLMLKQHSDEQNISHFDQHVRQLSIGAGICSEELPWVAMNVSKRIGYLKNQLQAADKVFRSGDRDEYEREVQRLYGLLREAWERGIEETLLGKIVERFRPGIQTMHIRKLTDISDEDCDQLDIGMTKCSKWLPGHDLSGGAQEPIPEPTELGEDIKAFEAWYKAINKRRS